MITAKGHYCDGQLLTPQPVDLAFDAAGWLQVNGTAVDLRVPLTDVAVSDRLGSVPRFLYLPDGITIETADNGAIDAALLQHRRGRAAALIHFLEHHSGFAAIATLLIVGLVGATLQYGLPALSRQTAKRLPPALEEQIGHAALSSVNRMLAPSRLSSAQRSRVTHALHRIAAARALPQRIRLVYYSMGPRYPNAFALPGGVIVVSDELVALADQPGELEAVLAHEIGHEALHHGVQSMLNNSFALLIVTSVTGDLSTLTSFAGTLPFLLLSNGYSRDNEREADAYACDLLTTAGIDVQHFVDILKKLEAARPESGVDYSYLSTHPGTTERIQTLERYARAHPVLRPSGNQPE